MKKWGTSWRRHVIWYIYRDTFGKTCLLKSSGVAPSEILSPLNSSDDENLTICGHLILWLAGAGAVLIILCILISESEQETSWSSSVPVQVLQTRARMSKLKRSATISIHTGLRKFIKDYCSKLDPKEWTKNVVISESLLLVKIYSWSCFSSYWQHFLLFFFL